MASIVPFFGVVINMINKGGEKNKRQNCCYAKEIGFSNEREMSSLKSQLSLSPFSDRLASLLNVYNCLKSLPWNSKRKTIFILSKIHGLGSLRKY